MQAKKMFLFVGEAFVLPWLTLMPVKSYSAENGSVPGSTNLFAAAVISEARSIVVGDRGRIFLSTDGAKTWKAVPSNTGQPLVSVCFPDDHHGWITGQGGVILHSADGGKTWEVQSSGVDTYLMAVEFIDSTNGCAVGTDSTVLMTSDGGKTWKKAPFKAAAPDVKDDSGPIEEFNLFAVVMIDDKRVCIAGDKGRIFFTEDAGQTWVEAKSPLYDEGARQGKILYSLAHDNGTLYAVGIDSVFLYSKDYGRTWTEGNTGFTEPDLYCISVAEGTGLAAGSGGHIIQTSDGGSTWQVVEVPERVTQSWLTGIALKVSKTALKKNQSGTVFGLIAGQNGTVGHYVKGTVGW
jgi:photosystem II stability/assembly factor-like uncharacterized protein